MDLIPATVNLRNYVQSPELVAKVRAAGDFVGAVKKEFYDREHKTGPLHATLMSPKARNLLEFRPGEVSIWAGFNGHRKSMFTSQVALDFCVQNEKVLIVSLEMTPVRTMLRMTRQAAGKAFPHPNYIDDLHQWTTGRLWIFDHLGRLDPEQCMALCRYFAQELDGSHVFIDSMMMVCGSEEHIDEQKQFVTDLVRLAKETGLHVHLVTHCRKPQAGEDKPPQKYDIRGASAISDQVDNVLTVWANKSKKAKLETNPHDEEQLAQPDALITCEKQRDGGWEGRLKFWFDDASFRFVDDRISPIEPYALIEGELL